MNVGYYFHVPAVFEADGTARVPGHYGVFVRGLAQAAGHATFYAHETPGDGTETDLLDDPNITCVNLGPVQSAPTRVALPGRSLKNFRPEQQGVDAMIVRSPTALLAGIVARCQKAGIPVLPFFVDEFRKWRPSRSMARWRNAVMPIYGRVHLRQIGRIMRSMTTGAIAAAIYEGHNAKDPNLVFTSTFGDADIATYGAPKPPWPQGIGVDTELRLLFTGRFAEEKGLFDLVDALVLLKPKYPKVVLELVGYSSNDRTLPNVLAAAEAAGVREHIEVTGFLAVGDPLFSAYQRADIYVLPTHGEGSVPRTIKEAFAFRTPVITTNIPHIAEYLTDGREAILIDTDAPDQIAAAVERVLASEADTRARVEHGFAWGSQLTNEKSAARALELLQTKVMR